ncbi:MAG: flagellar biosynthesis protein FlhA [Candidatus Omnitrophica bacterium]|nr:flagellar biosynthesis protein FlhA [Candidatus Omnitrophota bacterium]
MAEAAVLDKTPKGDLLNYIAHRSDVVIAVAIAAIIVVMIIPIPFILLDLLMTFSIGLALIILMSTVYLRNPLEMSSFPALLLITTLFRLSLNVASTRLILLHGDNFGGKLIKAFGQFVLGGNYVVGIIIFIIIFIVQIRVVVAGSGRIAEVAARFTLDAMPGKQLAIDADLNNGLIDELEATRRREDLSRQADFYGAMDGASKFVKGDVSAGILITFINIIGGFFIGVVQLGIPWQKAAAIYTILTVGDGLISQIPSIIISVSSGLIVTRAAARDNLGAELTKQLLFRPKALLIASGVMCALAFLGLPTIPFLFMSGIGLGSYYFLNKSMQQSTAAEDETTAKEEEKEHAPQNMEELLQEDPMELEIGYGLIALVDTAQGGSLLDRVTLIRRQCALELGVVVPPIRIRDNMKLKPNEYSIKIRGVEITKGELLVDHLLAMNAGLAEGDIPGIPTKEPAFGMPAVWIKESLQQKAENLGFTVVDPTSVLATHLTEIIKKYCYELLSRQEVKNILDSVKKRTPAVVEDVVPNLVNVGEIQKVLKNLLKERVPIKNMTTILETLADYAPYTKEADVLTEYVRHALARTISRQYQSGDGKIKVLTLDPRLEEFFVASIKKTEHTSYLAIEPKKAQAILTGILKEAEKIVQLGEQPIILCSPQIRGHVKRFTERQIPNLIILSYNEIAAEIELESQGVVTAL